MFQIQYSKYGFLDLKLIKMKYRKKKKPTNKQTNKQKKNKKQTIIESLFFFSNRRNVTIFRGLWLSIL